MTLNTYALIHIFGDEGQTYYFNSERDDLECSIEMDCEESNATKFIRTEVLPKFEIIFNESDLIIVDLLPTDIPTI